jgi:hypothetical protein
MKLQLGSMFVGLSCDVGFGSTWTTIIMITCDMNINDFYIGDWNSMECGRPFALVLYTYLLSHHSNQRKHTSASKVFSFDD